MATSYQDDYVKTALRLPADLHAKLMESARSGGRSFNAELIARLLGSYSEREFNPGAQAEILQAEAEKYRALADSFRAVADMGESMRVALSAMLARAIELSPAAAKQALADEGLVRSVAEFLRTKDPRGAAFSLVELIDGSNPELVEHLTNFASHLEDLGMVRKPVVLTVRGKQETGPYVSSPARTKPPGETDGTVNKVILVANQLDAYQRQRTMDGDDVPHPDNTPPGPRRSPNARRPTVKKR